MLDAGVRASFQPLAGTKTLVVVVARDPARVTQVGVDQQVYAVVHAGAPAETSAARESRDSPAAGAARGADGTGALYRRGTAEGSSGEEGTPGAGRRSAEDGLAAV